jgi:hypothetical protein
MVRFGLFKSSRQVDLIGFNLGTWLVWQLLVQYPGLGSDRLLVCW